MAPETMGVMQKTPHEVVQGQPPKLKESVKAFPTDHEVELLRTQRVRFEGYFTGPTW